MARTAFEQFGNYLLLARIAAGGMAEIFLSRPNTTMANGRFLVLKRILSHITDDSSFVKMFQSEIRVCMGLNHPNIVQIFDFGDQDFRPYFVMEYIDGVNLRQFMNKFSQNCPHPMPVEAAVSIGIQMAAGLSYAHTFKDKLTNQCMQIIHRDISPHNLLVTFGGNIKIIDFGVAKAQLESSEKTMTGHIKGKVSYLSPEQVAGQEVDPRADIFSAGLVLWELLTGRKLFDPSARTDYTVLKMIQNCERYIVPPSTWNPAISAELDQIVMKALAQNPNERYEVAADMQKSLRDFLFAYKPGYGYADLGALVSSLFSVEIEAQRLKMQELNQQAQNFLESQQSSETTAVMYVNSDPSAFHPDDIEGRTQQSRSSGAGTRKFTNMTRRTNNPSLPPVISPEVAREWMTALSRSHDKALPVGKFDVWHRPLPTITILLIVAAVTMDRKFALFDWFFKDPARDVAVKRIDAPVSVQRAEFKPGQKVITVIIPENTKRMKIRR